MSSCYLLDSPEDSLEGIYKRYTDIAKLSKFAGGIGVAWHRVRAKGSLIQGTNGLSNGIVPWLQDPRLLGRRGQPGRPPQGRRVRLPRDVARRHRGLPRAARQHRRPRPAHPQPQPRQLGPRPVHGARREGLAVELFDPKKVPHLTDLYGDDFERAYVEAEEAGLYEKQVPARQLYSRMMRTLAQTGNGWMTFKDASNEKCNQTGPTRTARPRRAPVEPVHRDPRGHRPAETAVCNLGSLNLGAYWSTHRRRRASSTTPSSARSSVRSCRCSTG
jgi:ribonucleoside-diphosphate reductase alpha chain